MIKQLFFILIISYAGSGLLIAADSAALFNARQSLSNMQDKEQATKLADALAVISTSNEASPEMRREASRQLLNSGNEDLALFALVSGKDSVDLRQKQWAIGDITLLTKAILITALPETPSPSGEEQASQLGFLRSLAGQLAKILHQPPPEPSVFSEGRITVVKAWLQQTLGHAAIKPESQGNIQRSLKIVSEYK